MKTLSMVALLAVMTVLVLVFWLDTEKQLDDCRFECNHLQTKLSRLQELSEYVLALEQLLSEKTWAELKAANEMILREKYRNYERVEQPIITKE